MIYYFTFNFDLWDEKLFNYQKTEAALIGI